jgi:hypothetical protein
VTWQHAAVDVIVVGAVAYLVWKLALAGRFRRGRPDVPVSRLSRGKQARKCHGGDGVG